MVCSVVCVVEVSNDELIFSTGVVGIVCTVVINSLMGIFVSCVTELVSIVVSSKDVVVETLSVSLYVT